MRIITFIGNYSYKEPDFVSGLVCFCHFENKDTADILDTVVNDLVKIAEKMDILLVPFSHLSENVMNEKDAEKLFDQLIKITQDKTEKKIFSAPFGVEKELHLNVSANDKNIKFLHF
jgi:hypothetical protein